MTRTDIFMKKYSVSLLTVILVFSFVLIDGSMLSLYAVGFSVLHEFAHIAALLLVGGRVGSLYAKGFGIALKTAPLSYTQELVTALSGPALSLFLFLIFLPFCTRGESLFFCCFCNLSIFFVNILPIYPLDGGRALYCLLCTKVFYRTACVITRVISCIFLLPLCIISVIILVRTGYNLSLLIICIYLGVLALGVKNL